MSYMKASYSLSNADNSQIEKQNSQKTNKTVKDKQNINKGM